MNRLFVTTGLLTGLVAMILTASPAAADEHTHGVDNLPTYGIAVIKPTKGNKVRGVLRLMQTEDALRITGQIRNLEPGEHGFHVHEYGDLRGTDGKATGGHFNPQGHDHGAPGASSHAGDLGNITANDDGVAKVDITTKDTKLHFVLGRAFVVHGGKDDLQSQPSGAAGPRVGTGVIGIGNPEYRMAK